METPGDSTLGTLSNDRSPRSESKHPVETPGNSTLGTLLNYRYPRSESKCPVERPSSSDTGTRYSVPPTTLGKPGTTIIPGSPVTPSESVRPVHTGQNAQKEKTDQCLDQSELPVLNSPHKSVQLEHNVHEQPGNMPNLQAEHWSEHSEAFQDFMNSESPNVRADESLERTHMGHFEHRSSGIGHTGNPLGIGHTGNRSDHEHSVPRS